MAITAWYMDDSDADQRAPHQQNPNKPCTMDELMALGVYHWKLDPANPAEDPEMAKIRQEQGYSYHDVITCSPDKLPCYEDKIKSFFIEHIHADNEVRCCLEGSGYFDVRDKSDQWIRIAMSPGDLITLPAGIYHRFTMDEKNFIKAMRLFVGDPVWTPINRPEADSHPVRSTFLEDLKNGTITLPTTAVTAESEEPNAKKQKGEKVEAQLQAWFMDDSEADQREPHQQTPNKPASLEVLKELGVEYWRMDPGDPAADPEMAKVRAERGYSYHDVIEASPDKLPGYEEKIKSFYIEHIHADDEVRCCLDGSGYFDVRDKSDKWIRIAMTPGDLITLPAGIYHRFTMDTKNFIKAMRLFVGDPVWTPINRPDADTHPMRAEFLTKLSEGKLTA